MPHRCYAGAVMPVPRPTRLSAFAPLLGVAVGTALGLIAFTVAGLLWRAGATAAATSTAHYAVFGGLLCLAATLVLGQPARRRRARVPINQALPHQWWPRETDQLPMIAACVGGPLLVGAGVAMLLFR